MTGLQVAILLGQDDIAKDIIQRTSLEDLDQTFGVRFLILCDWALMTQGDNTSLHLGKTIEILMHQPLF